MKIRSGRWTAVAVVGVLAAASTFVASCSAAREAIGISSAPLTVGGVVDIAPSRSELTGDWTPANAAMDADTLCVASNGSQWSWSQDHGTTWSTCNNLDASCNGTLGTFTPDAGALAGWFMQGSDQTLVADKLGHVVWVSMADNNSGCSTAKGVVAMVSSDGGKTFDFGDAVLLNDTACSNGCQDQPDATFDFSTSPPTLLTSWRHQGVQSPPGAYGACTRRYFIDSTSHLQPMDDAQSVGSLGLGSIGSVRIRSGGGAMSVVYSTTDSVPSCPNTGTTSEGVAVVTSYDWGHSWTGSNSIFDGINNYSGCVLSGQVDIARNPRNFDYVRAMDGTNYVIVQDTKSTLRLFMNTTYGGAVNGGPLVTWREWCPGTWTTADGGATTNWLTVGGTYCPTPFYTQGQASADGGSGNSLAMPNLASDDVGRLGVWFYEADSTDTMFHIHFRGNVSPRSPTSTWIDTDVSSNFTPGNCAGCSSPFRVLGDYQAMLVQGGLRQPTCGASGAFFPTWSFADTGGLLDAAATANPQTLDGGLTFP